MSKLSTSLDTLLIALINTMYGTTVDHELYNILSNLIAARAELLNAETKAGME